MHTLRHLFPGRWLTGRVSPLRRLAVLALLTLSLWVSGARAGDAAPPRRAELRLRDDTLVVGTVEALTAGVYTINTGSLGTVKVAAEQVLAIRYLDSGTAPLADSPAPAAEPAPAAAPAVAAALTPAPVLTPPIGGAVRPATPAPAVTPAAPAIPMPAAVASLPPQMQDLMTQVLNDPNTMAELDKLLNDPQVLDILNDPEVMKEVNSGSYLKLMTNPKFLKLMTNPGIRKIATDVVNPPAKPTPAPPAAAKPTRPTPRPVAKPAPAAPAADPEPAEANE